MDKTFHCKINSQKKHYVTYKIKSSTSRLIHKKKLILQIEHHYTRQQVVCITKKRKCKAKNNCFLKGNISLW